MGSVMAAEFTSCGKYGFGGWYLELERKYMTGWVNTAKDMS
jgi:hypothetical protein